MSEDGRGRWMRRSLGEFVVIVVGVLFALWVDQQVAAQADRRAGADYVAALIRDVESDLIELDTIEAWSSRSEVRIVELLRFVREEAEPSSRTVLEALEMSVWQRPFSMATYAIDELRSTGSLRLIQDAELRRSIARYYKDMEMYRVLLDISRDRIWGWLGEEIQPRVLTATDRLYGARLANRMNTVPTPPFPDEYEPPSIAELRRRLAAVPDTEEALGDALYLSRMIRNVVSQMRPLADQMLVDLEPHSSN